MDSKKIRRYVILSYIVFWFMVLGICGTASMVFHCPPLVMRILSNICAWAPTIVLIVGFKYFCPGMTIRGFYKKAFGSKINIVTLLAGGILVIASTLITVLILSVTEGKSFNSFWETGAYPLWLSFILSLTSGPTGEESGWRGYLRPYLNDRYNYFKASVLQGVIWAFWHTVLWFVDSDFSGPELIPYILSNVIVMTGLCFIMNYFMEKNDNLLYGIVIHFCFNILYCFIKPDIWFYVVLSAVYLFIMAVFMKKKDEAGGGTPLGRFSVTPPLT